MEAAEDRKARLARLRARKAERAKNVQTSSSQGGDAVTDPVVTAPLEESNGKRKREDEDGDIHPSKQTAVAASDEDANNEDEDSVKFRNYRPRNANLKHMQKDHAKPADVDSQVQHIVDSAGLDPEDTELDVVNLAPRKPNWDLKRDLDKKLDKLQRRTDRAIKDLIRERIAREQNKEVAAA